MTFVRCPGGGEVVGGEVSTGLIDDLPVVGAALAIGGNIGLACSVEDMKTGMGGDLYSYEVYQFTNQ